MSKYDLDDDTGVALNPEQQAFKDGTAGMGSLRRGWTSGRIGNEANALSAEELDARAAGDIPRADTLRGQLAALEQRRGLYAPEVGRVEDIHGIGDAGSWAAGQVGQGVASMLDPVAVGTGLSAVGRIAGAIPHPVAKGASLLAQGAGLAVPYMMNRTQLRGEFGNEARQDPELMARTTPTKLRDMAGDYATPAALLDTAVPGLVGRQLAGFGLGKGLSKMGPGAGTALGMAGEGGTEMLQDVGSKYAQGLLNPERDTSGDASSRLNSFAGGAVGGGPLIAAGAYADAGYRRVGDTAEKLGQKAGDVVDLLGENETVQAGVAGAKKLWGSAKEKTAGARGAVTDLMSDEDGKVSATALVENLKATTQDLKSSAQSALDERSVLNDMPPEDIIADDAKVGAWFADNAPKRAQLVADRLQAMGEDPEAQAHIEAIQSQDPQAQATAIDEAARFVLERTPLGRAESRAASLAQGLGKLAGVAAPAIGRGAVAAGKAALGFGKAVLSGAKEGMAKKNEQSNESAAPESFGAWRDRAYGVQGEAAAKQVLDQAAEEFNQRAELAGSYAADMAQRIAKRQPDLALLAKHAAYTLADTVMRVNAKGLGQHNVKLNRLVDDLYGAFRTETPEVVAQLGSIMGPKAAPVMEYVSQELAARMTPNGFRDHAGARNTLAQQVVGLIDPAAQSKLLAEGVNLNTPSGREQVLGLMEDYADGISSMPGVRQTYDRVFGAKSMGSILELLNGAAEEKAPDTVLAEPVDAQEARDAEKNVAKGAGPKVYAFHASPTLRTSSESNDAFKAVEKDGVMRRPMLFTQGQQLFGGKGDAIEKKIADVRQQLQDDPAYPDHDNYDVRAKPVLDVMREANMQPAKILQLYRDYMQMEYNSEKNPPEQRRYFAQQMRLANGMIQDGQYSELGGNPGVPMTAEQRKGSGIKVEKGAAQNFKTTPAERKELSAAATQYFKERFVVVGEQLSNRDPSKMAVTELLDMHKAGAGLIERSRIAEDPAQALSDANLLMFKSGAVKGGEVAIPAGKLVLWVRQQRGKSEKSTAEDTSENFSNASKDDAYLADVMEGVATLIGSGQVQGMPYKVNQFGERESFSAGVPPSLRLATVTYGAMKFGEGKRREGRQVSDEKFQGADQEAVAADQDKNDDFFTPDDRAERDLVVDDAQGVRSKRRSGKDDTRSAAQAQDEGGELVTREAGRGTSTKIRVDVSGQVVAEPKTDDTGKTPLDFATRQKDGAVPDEYANQRWLSRQTDADVSIDRAIGPEPKGTAASRAEFRAGKINEAFLNDPAKGQEMVRMRIRMAMAPEYSKDRGVVVGGVHYIAPLAAFVGPKNLSKNNVDLPAKAIQAIQAKVANILLKGDISKTERLKIARLMVEDPHTVTSFNVQAKLQRLADGVVQGKAVVAKQEAAKPDILSSAIAKRQEYLDNPPSDYTSEQARAIADWAESQLVRVRAQQEAEKGADADRQDQLSDYKYALLALQKKAASVLEGDESLKGFEGTAAPEVAKAGLPKGQLTQSGGSEGRKLNAQGAEHGPQIDSAAFKEWYGDWAKHTDGRADSVEREESRALGERGLGGLLDDADAPVRPTFLGGSGPTGPDGKPATYYHGSRDDISFFARQHGRQKDAGWLGRGVYLTTSPDLAHDYARVKRRADGTASGYGDQNIMPLYAAVKNPFFADSTVKDRLSRSSPQAVSAFTKRLKERGYDGVVLNLDHGLQELVAFEPGDVKSAISNNGEFNGNSPDLRKNQQDGPSHVSTQAERDAAVAYARKVLGPKIAVAFKDITGYSGEFIDAQNVIEISTTAAAGTLNTLYHEAMHVFFRDFVRGNPRAQAVFESLINDPKHLAKLHALLEGYPAAQAQLTSGEERLAYTYQFWKAGLLNVDAKAHTWLQKLGKFFRRVLGMVRDSERALELFQAFDNGKMSEPSAAGMVIAKAMDKGTNALALRRKLDGLTQGLAALTFPAGEILGRSASPTARKLATMFFTNPGEEAHGTEGLGLLNAQAAVAKKYNNVAHRLFENMAEGDQLAVQKYLQSGVLPRDVPLAEHREAVKAIRDLLERFHQHMVDSGVKIGKVENYYPTVWSAGALLAKKPAFIALLTGKYAQHLGTGKPAVAAERIWQSLVNKEGVDAHLPAGREDGVLAPFFASQEGRTLPWFEDVDKETFLDKNLVNTLTRYFHQGARASEYHRRFGENGVVLEKMLAKVNQELSAAGTEMMRRGEIKDEAGRVKWVSRQMRDISQSTGAMEGTLGKDVSPNMRKFNSWMAVYQNIRLLPMSLFSSFVDPLGIVARGAPLQAAYESFVYGLREVFRTWGDAFRDLPPDREKDAWRQLAEDVGASEIAMFGHLVSDQYSSVYMTAGAKKLNDKMFKFNGMEAWNRGMRVMATKWAVRFIESHAALPDKTHSARWLKEIGLTPDMITLDAEGRLVTNRHELATLKGISLEQATKAVEPIHQAIVRWTEGAVLTPNAAQRPGWASDPNAAWMFHLKQFSYSFQQTILKRAVNEFNHGNIAPVGTLAMFIPTMITADIMKGLIQGGGSLPPYMASMNAGDWLVHGYQRAGLAGVGTIGMDAAADISSLGGPAIEQIVDGLRDESGKTLVNAMPLHALYAQALK